MVTSAPRVSPFVMVTAFPTVTTSALTVVSLPAVSVTDASPEPVIWPFTAIVPPACADDARTDDDDDDGDGGTDGDADTDADGDADSDADHQFETNLWIKYGKSTSSPGPCLWRWRAMPAAYAPCRFTRRH